MSKIRTSLAKINWKLYIALLFMGLCPAVYTTVRTFFIGQMPGEWSYSIAAQLSWINLIYEVMDEAIILPLFFFMGKVCEDRDEFTNRLRTGIIVSAAIYAVLSICIMIFAVPMLHLMAASPEIINESAEYIRIESVANIIGLLYRFVLVAIVTIRKDGTVYALTVIKVLCSIVLDNILISQLRISLRLGVNGIGISNLLINSILLFVSVIILKKAGYDIVHGKGLSFSWMKDFLKVGGISGLESLIRNLAYMLMIVRMVNMVNEQGTYWVANNFIWGWLLFPVTQLGELIKQDVSTDRKFGGRNTTGYFVITGIICIVWIAAIPLYKPFMEHVLGYSDVEKLFGLVIVMLGFYMIYAFQNVFDAIFYGTGHTEYMLFESILTNTIYYGAAFILYRLGLWSPTLIGIALLFGFGNVFDALVSWLAYRVYLRRVETFSENGVRK